MHDCMVVDFKDLLILNQIILKINPSTSKRLKAYTVFHAFKQIVSAFLYTQLLLTKKILVLVADY